MNHSTANPFVNYSLLVLFGFITVSAFFAYAATIYSISAVMPWVIFTLFCLILFLVGRWLIRGIEIAQRVDPTTPQKIGSFETPYEASLLVSQLADHGIHATAVGGFVSGFQAESPGMVDVVVSKEDHAAAVQAIEGTANDSD